MKSLHYPVPVSLRGERLATELRTALSMAAVTVSVGGDLLVVVPDNAPEPTVAATVAAHNGAPTPAEASADSALQTAANTALVASLATAGVAGVPGGVIVMWSGLLSAIPSGWLLCDGQNGTPDLRGRFIKGALAAVNPGVTGGAATHTHANHVVTQPGAHAFTQPGAHSAHVVTQPGAHSAHVVTQPSAHADVTNHIHAHQLQGGTTAATTGTNVMASTATGGSLRAMAVATANPTAGGVASQAHAGTAVDAHSAHSGTAIDAHSAHTGGAVDAHTGTAVDAHSTVGSEPAFYSLAYIQKT